MNVDLWNRIYGHKSRGLGGAVDDGDARHPVHSRMVKACGDWLNGQRGVLVWATGTGCWTGKGTKGTPGVPDLAGWRTMQFVALAKHYTPAEDEHGLGGWGGELWIHGPGYGTPLKGVDELHAVALYVECKVLPDKLNPAQAEFRRMAEAAGALYFLAEWDGEGADPAAGLREQWGERDG